MSLSKENAALIMRIATVGSGLTGDVSNRREVVIRPVDLNALLDAARAEGREADRAAWGDAHPTAWPWGFPPPRFVNPATIAEARAAGREEARADVSEEHSINVGLGLVVHGSKAACERVQAISEDHDRTVNEMKRRERVECARFADALNRRADVPALPDFQTFLVEQVGHLFVPSDPITRAVFLYLDELRKRVTP